LHIHDTVVPIGDKYREYVWQRLSL
jgi:hypothetical protein